ncbi:hypothetical protein ACF058_26755 [Streptomyces sp. NPDC015501]|uniref:hypothetical protein n=1 Tax=unclassified Streptomyces TaxID=2593676 RepID=UPI00119CFA6D|nr:hypothetical protein A3L22_17780 [Streptomyces griseus subsp. griseus]WSS58281.1 hypothetical protein OG543_24345 [Streptomyces sp. NBC_01178]
MPLLAIAYMTAWLVFSLLGFWKLADPRRQMLLSGSLVVVAVGVTFGMLRNAGLGVFVFGIGVIAALVRLRRAWGRPPIAPPR